MDEDDKITHTLTGKDLMDLDTHIQTFLKERNLCGGCALPLIASYHVAKTMTYFESQPPDTEDTFNEAHEELCHSVFKGSITMYNDGIVFKIPENLHS